MVRVTYNSWGQTYLFVLLVSQSLTLAMLIIGRCTDDMIRKDNSGCSKQGKQNGMCVCKSSRDT
jgi:hypothetical protein